MGKVADVATDIGGQVKQKTESAYDTVAPPVRGVATQLQKKGGEFGEAASTRVLKPAKKTIEDWADKGQQAGNRALESVKESGNQAWSSTKKALALSPQDAGSTESAFAILAPALKALVPQQGDSGTFSAYFKIPLGKLPGSVGMKVEGWASHGAYMPGTTGPLTDSAFGIHMSVSITGAITIHAAEVGINAGTYLTTQGPDAAGALKIASWTLYRNLMAESNLIPREVVDAIYGRQGQTTAEWDEAMQEEYLPAGSKNYGAAGLSAGFSAGGKLGSAVSGEIAVTAMAGRVYDAKSLAHRQGGTSTTQKLTGRLPSAMPGSKRGAQASLGDRTVAVVASGEVTAPHIAGGSLKLTVGLRKAAGPDGAKPSWTLTTVMVDAIAHMAGLATLAAAGGIGAAVAGLVASADNMASRAEKQVTDDKGHAADGAVAEISSFRRGLADAVKLASSLDAAVLPGISDVAAEGQIHLYGGMQATVPTLSVAFEKLVSVEADAHVVGAKFEKVQRIGSIDYNGGKKEWVVHFGELSATVGESTHKGPPAQAKHAGPHQLPQAPPQVQPQHAQAQPAQGPRAQAHQAQAQPAQAKRLGSGKRLPPVPTQGSGT